MDSMMEASMKVMNSDYIKIDHLDEINYPRWRDKMMFLLIASKITYVLNPNLMPIASPMADEDQTVMAERTKWKEDEVLCRGLFLDTLSD